MASDGTPITPTENTELEVYVSGITQRPGIDFNVATDTIVFVSPPEADAEVWILWLEPFGGGGEVVCEAYLDCGTY